MSWWGSFLAGAAIFYVGYRLGQRAAFIRAAEIMHDEFDKFFDKRRKGRAANDVLVG